MAKTLTRNKEMPTFFGEIQLKGVRKLIDSSKDMNEPTLFYNHPNGQLWHGNSIQWLKSLESESIDMIFADPPYNIKKADWISKPPSSRYKSIWKWQE